MKVISTVLFLLTLSLSGYAKHEMQHGFIIADDEIFFSHLVASGHHSHQLSFNGSLEIEEPNERELFTNRNKKGSYFLFQAQKLNLPQTYKGQVLTGHIVESPVGEYTPHNVIVREAKIRVEDIKINVVNPFFGQ